jgi:hypothetical protein
VSRTHAIAASLEPGTSTEASDETPESTEPSGGADAGPSQPRPKKVSALSAKSLVHIGYHKEIQGIIHGFLLQVCHESNAKLLTAELWSPCDVPMSVPMPVICGSMLAARMIVRQSIPHPWQ